MLTTIEKETEKNTIASTLVMLADQKIIYNCESSGSTQKYRQTIYTGTTSFQLLPIVKTAFPRREAIPFPKGKFATHCCNEDENAFIYLDLINKPISYFDIQNLSNLPKTNPEEDNTNLFNSFIFDLNSIFPINPTVITINDKPLYIAENGNTTKYSEVRRNPLKIFFENSISPKDIDMDLFELFLLTRLKVNYQLTCSQIDNYCYKLANNYPSCQKEINCKIPENNFTQFLEVFLGTKRLSQFCYTRYEKNLLKITVPQNKGKKYTITIIGI